MQHLVEGHMGGYYISDRTKEEITRTCSQCGDSDWIILSFSKKDRVNAIKDYFSSKVMNKYDILEQLNYMDVEEMDDDIEFDYDCDKCMVKGLFEDGYIDELEKDAYLKVINDTHKKQLKLFKKTINDMNKPKVLTKSVNNKK